MSKQLRDGTWLNDDGRITRFQPNPNGPGWLCPCGSGQTIGQDSACGRCHSEEAAKMPIEVVQQIGSAVARKPFGKGKRTDHT